MTEKKELTKQQREEGDLFAPKFDECGLMACVVMDAQSHEVLVLAFMNKEALELTLETDEVHFWSRSRNSLWKKGETSGNILKVCEILVDCDQDAILVRAEPAGPTCHTGRSSCFYRRIEKSAKGPMLSQR